MSDLHRWLESLGLEEDLQALQDGGVDLDGLPYLSDRHLSDIGLSITSRRRILAALSGAGGFDTRGLRGVDDHAGRTSSAVAREAERRRVTVLFCDLVDSTSLCTRLDPEELSNVLRKYRDACAAPVEHYGGFTGRFVGDGILTYFGYPVAREDDVERALSAALDVVKAVGSLNSDLDADVDLAVRIGVATGFVVAGDLVGVSQIERDAIVGEAPNLASRLQALAHPNSIIVCAETTLLAGQNFVFEELPEQNLKGFKAPVSAYRLLAAQDMESRFAARTPRPVPFIGRARELEVLLKHWGDAERGKGSLILLRGGPGIGKSRVVERLHKIITGKADTTLRYCCIQCSQHHANTALYPLIKFLEREAGFAPSDSLEEKLGKLRRFLEIDGFQALPASVFPLLADLLDITAGSNPAVAGMTPQQRRDRTLLALSDWLEHLARAKPLLMLIEDAQWMDPTFQELLDICCQRVADAGAMVVVTHRPEFEPSWSRHAEATPLTLDSFSDIEATELVHAVAGDNALPRPFLREVLSRTEGVPLYIEEVTKALLESDRASEPMDPPAEGGPSPAILSRVHAPLMARIDQLGPVKEIAQLGAVIGREFPYRLLQAISSQPRDLLESALRRLTQSELVFVRGSPPDSVYSFKHALIQEAAYKSLLRRKRQSVHRKIAQALERQEGRTVDNEPELLAFHYSHAGEPRNAITYWQRAAWRALEHSAQIEAEGHLRKALQNLAELDDETERRGIELDLLLELGTALRATRGYAAPEVENTYLKARELCHDAKADARRFSVDWALMQIYLVQGKVKSAASITEDLHKQATDQSDRLLLMDAHLAMGMARFHEGDFTGARDSLEQSVALHEGKQVEPRLLTHGQDPKVFALSYLSFALWFLGFADKARASVEEAMAYARTVSHDFSYVSALAFALRVYVSCRQFDRVLLHADRLIAISEENGYAYYEAVAKVHQGWAIVLGSGRASGLQQMREGMGALEKSGTVLGMPGFLVQLAEACACLGMMDDAIDVINDAESDKFAGGTRSWDAEIRRLEGEFLASGDRPSQEAAEAAFRAALQIADSQKAGSLVLRTSLAYARLLKQQGRVSEALDLLRTALSGLEGVTAELRMAEKMVGELSETQGV